MLLGAALLCSGRAANKSPGQKVAAPVTEAEHDMYQHMVFPDEESVRARFSGPDYVWDTKGFPRRVEEVEKNKKNKKKTEWVQIRIDKTKNSEEIILKYTSYIQCP